MQTSVMANSSRSRLTLVGCLILVFLFLLVFLKSQKGESLFERQTSRQRYYWSNREFIGTFGQKNESQLEFKEDIEPENVLRKQFMETFTSHSPNLEDDEKKPGLEVDKQRTGLIEGYTSLWMAIGGEMVSFDPALGSVRSFRAADGFPHLVHTKSSYRSRDGYRYTRTGRHPRATRRTLWADLRSDLGKSRRGVARPVRRLRDPGAKRNAHRYDRRR